MMCFNNIEIDVGKVKFEVLKMLRTMSSGELLRAAQWTFGSSRAGSVLPSWELSTY